jgi:hypothetical protein
MPQRLDKGLIMKATDSRNTPRRERAFFFFFFFFFFLGDDRSGLVVVFCIQ